MLLIIVFLPGEPHVSIMGEDEFVLLILYFVEIGIIMNAYIWVVLLVLFILVGVFLVLIFELLQCFGYMGFLYSRCIACNSSGHKTEIFGTPCILWNNWYDARYNYGNQCL